MDAASSGSGGKRRRRMRITSHPAGTARAGSRGRAMQRNLKAGRAVQREQRESAAKVGCCTAVLCPSVCDGASASDVHRYMQRCAVAFPMSVSVLCHGTCLVWQRRR